MQKNIINMVLSILLATYNSSKYLKEQIESVQNQTVQDWRMYIREDGSTDDTLKMIADYQKSDSRIHIFSDGGKNIGAAKSFMKLLEHVKADYYMFCDHDDVWLPTKIEKSLQRIKLFELNNPHIPIVVHTDLLVVDEQLNVINKSYWKSVGLKPAVITSGEMIQVFNCVTGCTMLFNNLTKEVALPYNERAPMHDWWIAIQVIRNKGAVIQVEEALIKYRQHGTNEIGAKKVDANYYVAKIKNFRETIRQNVEKINFLKEIKGIGTFKYLYYKIYYNITRKI
jgi:glycosyltransferase involved in cell wall biosynthesis